MKKYNEVAAAWWANKLRNVTPASFNNGDESSAGGMGMLMMFLVADKRSPETDKVDAFEKELAQEIESQVKEFEKLYISCDYAPDIFLSDIAVKYGIDCSCFPWKTTMLISKDEVKVSCGCGRPYNTIYPENNKKEGE